MKTKYAAILTNLYNNCGKTVQELDAETGYAAVTIRRWMKGETKIPIDAFYELVEAMGGSRRDAQAEIGTFAMEEWEKAGYKNPKELIDEFAVERATMIAAHTAEKEQMRQDHAQQIEKLKSLRLEVQAEFRSTVQLLTDRYEENSRYLIGQMEKTERLNDQMTQRATAAEHIAQEAQKRATIAEKRADDLDKRRHHVFWAMFVLVFILMGVIVASMVIDVPFMGWGNVMR